MNPAATNRLLARRPGGLWRRRVQGDVREILASLAKGTASALAENPLGVASAAIDIVKKTTAGKDAGELAWLLTARALARAIRVATAIVLPVRQVAEEDVQQFASAVVLFMGEQTWPLTKSFFSAPAKLDAVQSVADNFQSWLTLSQGVPDDVSAHARRAVIDELSPAMAAEWREHTDRYKPIADVVRGPFAEASEGIDAWRAYHQTLREQCDEPVFDEQFSLRQIYIPLRAKVERSGKPEVLNAAAALQQWLDANDVEGVRDALRVVSGGPGSGKSSFMKMFAASATAMDELAVLFVPLHLFDFTSDLETAIAAFTSSTGAPAEPFSAPYQRLLLIFDGLDELEMMGQHGAEVALQFVQSLGKLLQRRNRKKRRVLAVVTGREVLIQRLPKFVPPERILALQSFVIEPVLDPEGVFADQRDEWWQTYGRLKGRPWTALPEELARKELEELTAQPLLNYLVALSFERGRVDFRAAPNLNVIYDDLLHAVYERRWAASEMHPSTNMLESFDEFERVLQQIAVTTLEGNGRTATLAEVARRCSRAGLGPLLSKFTTSAEAGLARFLTAFYFRFRGQRDGEQTFEFTHKSFSEYLGARWAVDTAVLNGSEVELLKLGRDRTLEMWARRFGTFPLDHYIFRFLEAEIPRRDSVDRKAILTAARLALEADLQHGPTLAAFSPPEDEFVSDLAWRASNSGTMALTFLSVIAAATEKVEALEVNLEMFSRWLHTTSGGHAGGQTPIVLRALTWLALPTGADFKHHDLWNAQMAHSLLPRARFDNAVVSHANLMRCDLTRATFDGTVMRSVSLEHSTLTAATFQDANCTEAHFSGAILDDAEFYDTTFADAHLDGASCTRAQFAGCSFSGAKALKANFNDATITGWIIDADFTGADFTDADLRNAVFIQCVVDEAIFGRTKVSPATFAQIALAPRQAEELVVMEGGLAPD